MINGIKEYMIMGEGKIWALGLDKVDETQKDKQIKDFIKRKEDRWAFENLMLAVESRVSMKCPHCRKSLNVGVYSGCEDAIYDGFGKKIKSHKKICDCGRTFFVLIRTNLKSKATTSIFKKAVSSIRKKLFTFEGLGM